MIWGRYYFSSRLYYCLGESPQWTNQGLSIRGWHMLTLYDFMASWIRIWEPLLISATPHDRYYRISFLHHLSWVTVLQWGFDQQYLVDGFNPSEKYESQLGWLFPINLGKYKSCSSHHQPEMHLRSYIYNYMWPAKGQPLRIHSTRGPPLGSVPQQAHLWRSSTGAPPDLEMENPQSSWDDADVWWLDDRIKWD